MSESRPVPFAPRPHQLEALETLAELREVGEQRALVVFAPGLGKTVVAAHDVAQFEREIGRPAAVLYLSHQGVILDQAQKTLEAILGGDRRFGRFDGDAHDFGAQIIFATFQSMHRHLSRFDRAAFDYVIVDEAHHTAAPTRDEVVAYFRTLFRLGLTATPFRGDGQDILEYYGNTTAAWLPLERALAQGLLTPIDYRVISDPVDEEALDRALDSAGRTSAGGAFRHQNDRAIVDTIMRLAVPVAERHRILVFCASIPQLHHFAPLFAGARTITGDNGRAEQIATITAFNNGEFEVILSRDVLNEGIDIPDASTLVFLRNTESPVVFLQQLGRGLRKAIGKERVLVLDFVDNVRRIEFAYGFMNQIAWEEEIAERQQRRRDAPRSLLTLDQTAQDVIGSLLRKRIESGFLVDIDGLSRAFDGAISTATLRRIAATDALPPEFGSAAFTQRATLYFDRTTVTRFMRLAHNPRVPDGLIGARTLAKRIGQPVSWVRRQQDSGRLPAAWFHKRGNGQIDLFYEPGDVARAAAVFDPVLAPE